MLNQRRHSNSSSGGSDERPDGGRRRAKANFDALALALIVLLFAETLLFGANRRDLAVAFAVPQFLLLALIALSRGADLRGLPLRWPAVLMAVVFALGIFSILPVGPPLAHPLWSYVRGLVPGTSATISLEPFATRVEMVKLAGLAAVFLCAASIGARRDGGDAMGRYLTVIGVLYCLWAAVAFVVEPKTVFGVPKPYGWDRLGASFFTPNSAGTLFACLTLFGLVGVLGPLIRERRPAERFRPAEFLKRWPQAMLCLLAFSCLLMTASRGALLSLGASVLLILAALTWIKSAKGSIGGGFIVAACLVLMVGVTMFVFGGENAAARFARTTPLTEDRLQIFTAYGPAIMASPWLGYGLGAFSSINALSMTTGNALALASLGAVHNVYLQWLLQEGFPGALAMFGAVGVIVLGIARGLTRRDGQRWLVLACLGMACIFAVHGLVDFALEEPSLAALFSAILGLGYGLAERPARDRGR